MLYFSKKLFVLKFYFAIIISDRSTLEKKEGSGAGTGTALVTKKIWTGI
jgi:hypothetical protein